MRPARPGRITRSVAAVLTAAWRPSATGVAAVLAAETGDDGTATVAVVCGPGFTSATSGTDMDCAPCSNRCSQCDSAGAFRCDPGACQLGYYADGFCLPCKVPGCGSCQSSGTSGCDACLRGFYEAAGAGASTCERCPGYLCNACHGPDPGDCDECGFGHDTVEEWGCSPHFNAKVTIFGTLTVLIFGRRHGSKLFAALQRLARSKCGRSRED